MIVHFPTYLKKANKKRRIPFNTSLSFEDTSKKPESELELVEELNVLGGVSLDPNLNSQLTCYNYINNDSVNSSYRNLAGNYKKYNFNITGYSVSDNFSNTSFNLLVFSSCHHCRHHCSFHTENFYKIYRRNINWWRKRKFYTGRRKREQYAERYDDDNEGTIDKCYQCILCPPMFFQSKKKRLWRARVTNINPMTATQQLTATNIAAQRQQQQQQQQHQQHRFQQQQQTQLVTCQSCCQQHQTHSYQTYTQHQQQQQQQQQQQLQNLNRCRTVLNQNSNSDSRMASPVSIDGEVGGGCGDGYYSIERDCCLDYAEDEDQTMSSSTTATTTASIAKCRMMTADLSTTTTTKSSLARTDSITMDTSPVKRKNATSMTQATATIYDSTATATATATAAANVFRNCCGGNNDGGNTTDSSTSNFYRVENAKMISCQRDNVKDISGVDHCAVVNDEKELFLALFHKLKGSQLTTLCQVIENRATTDNHHTDCVLVPRELILSEEPNVIACRLWRWPDLKCSSELKRIPSCPNEKDRVYVCCNPSHWSRLCVPDSPPPPYQPLAMDRLKTKEDTPKENVADDGLRLFPGSLTTDDEDSSSQGWCQLAYWELAERVGRRFLVGNSSVNIFSDQPQGDGMCLKTLAEQRRSATPDSVRKARQKIGLGVTLSQEADGVWLYNRSSVPVFVHSPTLNDIDCFLQVFKVPPGYCLKAYDNYRAKTQNLVWPSYVAGAKTGPVDTLSMRISFAKGWGPNYKRQDVTACPCWIEVLLSRR